MVKLTYSSLLRYAGYPYAAYHHAPLATGYAHVSPSASLNIAGLANAAVPAIAGGYAGAGRYVANSAGKLISKTRTGLALVLAGDVYKSIARAELVNIISLN